MRNLNNLERSLKIDFQNKDLLAQAMVHRSFLNENPNSSLSSNERMEFLGDAVLSFVISDFLYARFPHYQEGDLTNLRSRIVRTTSLAQIAKKLRLGDYLLMGRGEEESGGKQKASLLANSVEALIGAVYLDQGVKAADSFIKQEFSSLIEKLVKKPKAKDFKSTLQEKVQSETKTAPAYRTLKASGPPHSRTFTIGVFLKRKLVAEGRGNNKQEAEQKAAQAALEKLGR